jgi:hypothetical protein
VFRRRRVLISVLTMLCFRGAQAEECGLIDLHSVHSFPTGGAPIAIAVKDLNGDGKLDLMVVNSNSVNIAVLIGTGEGSFKEPVEYPVGEKPRSLGVADVNGDNKPDLMTANHDSGNISVLLGIGDGTFGTAMSQDVASSPSAMVIADIDGDGKADIAIGTDEGTVIFLMGNGDGTFNPKSQIELGGPVSSLIAESKDDRALDLIVGAGTDIVSLKRTASNGFIESGRSATGTIAIQLMGSGDLNGDGKTDLAIVNKASSDLRIFYGNEDGTFSSGPNYTVGDRHPPGELSIFCLKVKDLDGDGKLDLLATANDGSLAVLFGKGDGTFPSIVRYGGVGISLWVETGDFNSDDLQDVAVASFGIAKVSIIEGLGRRKLGSYIKLEYFPEMGAIGDLNKDGILDVVGAELRGISVRLGTGDGGFAKKVLYASGSNSIGLALEDVDGDRKLDAIVGWGDGNLSVLMGKGDGTLGEPIISGARSSSQSIHYMFTGDFNNDGRVDVILNTAFCGNCNPPTENGSWIYLGKGDGTFEERKPTGTLETYAVGDLNNDGKLDLVGWKSIEEMMVLFGKGDGTFGTSLIYPWRPLAAGCADFNHDGNQDLVLVGWKEARILLNDGQGNLTSSTVVAGIASQQVVIADFNGDGEKDIVIGGNPTVPLFGKGDGTFEAATPLSPHEEIKSAGDLNGDGIDDLLTMFDVIFSSCHGQGRSLRVSNSGGKVVISWAGKPEEFQLESASQLSAGEWVVVPDAPVSENGYETVTIPHDSGTRFFRLKSLLR